MHFIFLSELQDKLTDQQSKQNFFCECTSSVPEKCSAIMQWYWWVVIITSGHVAPTMTTFVLFIVTEPIFGLHKWAAEFWPIQELKEVQSCYMSLKDLQQPAMFSQNISCLRFSSLCELRNLCQTKKKKKEVGGIKYPYKEDSLFSYSGCSVQGKVETSEDWSTGDSS